MRRPYENTDFLEQDITRKCPFDLFDKWFKKVLELTRKEDVSN